MIDKNPDQSIYIQKQEHITSRSSRQEDRREDIAFFVCGRPVNKNSTSKSILCHVQVHFLFVLGIM